MEELCKLLQMNWDEKCIDWMRSAVEHCTEVMHGYKTPDSDLWAAMRSAFATESSSGNGFTSSDQLGPEANPNELNSGECTTLLTTIARDYFVRWPYVQVLEIMNVGSWILLLVVLGILSIFAVLGIAYTCRRKLNRMTDEKKNHSSGSIEKIDSNSNGDTTTAAKTIVIKVVTGSDDGITNSNSHRSIETIEIFHLSADGVINDWSKELPYKRATFEEILNFLDYYPSKLRVLLLLDDVKVYDDVCKRCVFKRQENKLPKLSSRSPSHTSVTSVMVGRSRIPVVYRGHNQSFKSGN